MNNLIEIHVITFNEEIMLPFLLQHLKKTFTNPKIIIHDNYSTDQTQLIAEKEGCTVIPFYTTGMNDTIQSEIKSKAVIEATSKYCMVIDCDELCYLSEEELINSDVDIYQFQGFNIFDKVVTPFLTDHQGVYDEGYSKPVCIRTENIKNIKFAAGCHSIDFVESKNGEELKWSKKEFILGHYKHWSLDYNIGRSAFLASRQSQDNLDKGHSFHMAFPAEMHTAYFNEMYSRRIPFPQLNK